MALRLRSKSTLSSRLTTIFILLSTAFFIVFSSSTLFILYSLEDAMFNQQLRQARSDLQAGKAIAGNILQLDNLVAYQYEAFTGSAYGEFSAEGRHFHYVKIASGYLLLDVTDQLIVQRGLTDIAIILSVVLIVALLCSVLIARKLSKLALEPFHQLSALFCVDKPDVTADNIGQIKEQDIQRIAKTLQVALDKQVQVANELVFFNQGMSHELRTPLQVVHSSVELLVEHRPELASFPAYQRLQQAVERMRRISAAMLWLASKDEYSKPVDVSVCLKNVQLELSDFLLAHKLVITEIIDAPCWLNLPKDVCELILINLIMNAVYHAQESQEGKQLRVRITGQWIEFSNIFSIRDAPSDVHSGIGLMLVRKLTQRFDVKLVEQIDEAEFTVRVQSSGVFEAEAMI